MLYIAAHSSMRNISDNEEVNFACYEYKCETMRTRTHVNTHIPYTQDSLHKSAITFNNPLNNPHFNCAARAHKITQRANVNILGEKKQNLVNPRHLVKRVIEIMLLPTIKL